MIVNGRRVFFKGLEFVSKIETFFRFRTMYGIIFKFCFMYKNFFKSMKPSLVQYGIFFFGVDMKKEKSITFFPQDFNDILIEYKKLHKGLSQ